MSYNFIAKIQFRDNIRILPIDVRFAFKAPFNMAFNQVWINRKS